MCSGECVFKNHYNVINQQMFLKYLLCVRHPYSIVIGLYLELFAVSRINIGHWKYCAILFVYNV